MSKIVLLSVAAGAAWLGLTYATAVRDPVVEVRATPACAPQAEAWVAELAEWGYKVVRTETAAGACLAGRAAGFELTGAVPAKDIAYLLRKKPKSVSGLAVEGDRVVAITIDGPAPFPPPAKEKS